MRSPYRRALMIAPALVALAMSLAYADSKLKGWVTKVNPAEQTIEVDGRTIPTKSVLVTGGPLEPGVFVSAGKGRIKVKPQRRPAEDQLVRYSAARAENPGRVEFSHLRHFDALGEKRCTTCHSSEMGLAMNPTHASRAADPTLEPHGPRSAGRFCTNCHNGTTSISQVSATRREPGPGIFTSLKTRDPEACRRCHAPADHGRDFTSVHGETAERAGSRPCLTCHVQDWSARDRQRHAGFLAAEQTLKANPDDPTAALAVGPNNFCVYCHRRDTKWQR